MKTNLVLATFLAAAAGAIAAPRDVNDTMIFTMQEMTDTDYGLNLAQKAGSEFLIRGWFKWNQAPRCEQWRAIPEKAHAMGALFGGGITCSALYDAENGITREQLLDMATRRPDGELADAWGQRGIRHGSLSSPAYLDYLFRWCREQIDAGVDYLFMDENNAALGANEGFDDYSLADFRRYLLEICPQTSGWKHDDPRWTSEWKIALTNRAFCPDGTMATFDYRGFLRTHGLLENPHQPKNPLDPLWRSFRGWRDDRAWKSLTDRIHAYGKERGRTILISANGLAKYVGLQVLGVWGYWAANGGHIELRENQIASWRTQVERGQVLAGRVPVVFFHDWGFGNPPFPFQAVPPAERIVWMRTRGPEIFAAGGRFAFPVLGPFGCDAKRDGTLDAIAKQAAFYRQHRDLFVNAEFLGCESPHSATPNLSLAVSSRRDTHDIVLHVINRNFAGGTLQAQTNVIVQLPLDRVPVKATVVSPDFAGEESSVCRIANEKLNVTFDKLDAYSIAILHFDGAVDLRGLRDPARTPTTGRWSRPTRNEFRVRPDGLIEDPDELNSFIQGKLHQEMRNPPTFLVNTTTAGRLQVHVRAVSSAGAKLEYQIDGVTKQTVDLPDLDHKNDEHAPEYDRTFTFAIPAGKHRLTVDNTGPDWASVSWFAFEGAFAPFE